MKLANLVVFIALYEIGVLYRRADLAFDFFFCVVNVPVITVLNEIGVLDRRADLAFHIGFPIANTPVITVLNEIGVPIYFPHRFDNRKHAGAVEDVFAKSITTIRMCLNQTHPSGR